MLLFINRRTCLVEKESNDTLSVLAAVSEYGNMEMNIAIPWTDAGPVNLTIKIEDYKVLFFGSTDMIPISMDKVEKKLEDEHWCISMLGLFRIIETVEKTLSENTRYIPVFERWLMKKIKYNIF